MPRKRTPEYKPWMVSRRFEAEWRGARGYYQNHHDELEAIIRRHKESGLHVVRRKKYLRPARDGETLLFNHVIIEFIGDLI